MAKKENEQVIPLPTEIPTIKKIVTCLKCGAKMEVEFEIDLQALIPTTLADTLAEVGMPKEEEKEMRDDEFTLVAPVEEKKEDGED